VKNSLNRQGRKERKAKKSNIKKEERTK